MSQKTVLLDLSDLKNPTCGFGQIALNYARIFSELSLHDLRFVLLLPIGYPQDLEQKVECHYVDRKRKSSYRGVPHVDLWHSVNQNQLHNNASADTKMVLTIHDLNFLREKGWLSQQKHKWRMRRQLRRADQLTVISEFVAAEIEHTFGYKKNDIKVIYDAVERIDDKPQRKPAFVEGTKPFFFTIGQVRMKKNFHLLLDVMKQFTEYNLYICGDDHFAAGRLIRERIEKERITNVVLPGKIADEERIWLYAHCEAFLFPSQGEGFGLPAIEAMQFGRAVFVAPFTCLPEITGGHAIVWKDVLTQTMVDSIRKNLPHFYDDDERISAMKEYARSFSYESHVEQYLAVYRELLGQQE
ncbi:MAG: glycosyltransferase family 4 protein [Bacteroidales bacterium]|nr:glycosyltransferase family 4 protein [Bacteroidales bacterium]